MGKVPKATKKFARTQLPAVIKQRRLKQKARRKQDAAAAAHEERESKQQASLANQPHLKPKPENGGFGPEDMDVDEFMQMDFVASDTSSSDDDAGDNDVLESNDEDEARDAETKQSSRKAPTARDKKEVQTKQQKAKQQGAAKPQDEASSSSSEDENDDPERLKRDIEEHQRELERLKAADPDFYSHLAANARGLLEFDMDDDEAQDRDGAGSVRTAKRKRGAVAAPGISTAEDMDEDDDDAAEERLAMQEMEDGIAPPTGSKRQRTAAVEDIDRVQDEDDHEEEDEPDLGEEAEDGDSGDDDVVLTSEMVKSLRRQAVTDKSLAGLRRLLRVFRAGCHVGDEEEKGKRKKRNAMEAASPALFNAVMKLSLENVVPLLDYHLKREPDKPLKQHSRWSVMQPLVRSYLGNLLHFLRNLVDAKMIRIVLLHSEPTIPYFVPFVKLASKFLRGLLQVWSTSEEATRIEAFLRIRQLALAMPTEKQFIDTVLKDSYLTYVRNSKFLTSKTASHAQFMANCVVELYSLDPLSAYQYAFVYIRQLAIHLRNAIMQKTDAAIKSVYNWQFLNCLRVWTRLLSLHGAAADSVLHALIYPLVQVSVGVIQLVPSPRYFPLRLYVCRLLNELSSKADVYIPVASHVLTIFDSHELRGKGVHTKAKAQEIRYMLKVSKTMEKTRPYLQGLATEAVDVLLDHFAANSYSIAFPELVAPVQIQLKKFMKVTKASAVRKQVSLLLERIQRNVQWVVNERSKIDYAPRDLSSKGLSSIRTFERINGKPATSPLSHYLAVKAKAAAEEDKDKDREDGEGSQRDDGDEDSKSPSGDEQVDHEQGSADDDDDDDDGEAQSSEVEEDADMDGNAEDVGDDGVDDTVNDLVLSDEEDE